MQNSLVFPPDKSQQLQLTSQWEVYDKEQTKIGSDLTEEEPRFDFPIYIQYFEDSQFFELEISCSKS